MANTFPNIDAQFSSEMQPKKNGRPKGVRNRATIAKAVLEMKVAIPKSKLMDKVKEIYPNLPKKMNVEQLMTLVQAAKAIQSGDTQAYKAIQDSAYGAPVQELEHTGDRPQINFINISHETRFIDGMPVNDRLLENQEPDQQD